jgi:septation ring formation regulator EzrA
MGRTVPTITQTLNETEALLRRFRRTLRRGDQILLDDLLASAHRHIAAIAETQALLPFEGALLAILLEQARRLAQLEQRLSDLEQAWSPHEPREP